MFMDDNANVCGVDLRECEGISNLLAKKVELLLLHLSYMAE